MDKTRLRNHQSICGDVWKHLDDSYKWIALGELADKSKHIEDDIESFAITYILQYFSKLESFSNATETEFILNKQLYHIRHGPRLDKPSLEIFIINSSQPQITSIHRMVQIKRIGYFNSIELHVVAELAYTVDELQEIVSTIYKSAYAWLEESFFEKLSALERGFANALYRHLRTVLELEGKAELAKQVWFSVFSSKDGYYAIDGKAAEAILQTLKQRRFSSDYSPLFHIVKLLGLEMPFKKSLSKYVIADGQYKEFPLSNAEYIIDMAHIYKTEAQMTQGAAYAIFHITNIGDRNLVVSFPASLKSDLLPIFEESKNRLGEIYKNESRAMTNHVDRIRANFRRIDKTELGGFFGGIIGGIYKQIVS